MAGSLVGQAFSGPLVVDPPNQTYADYTFGFTANSTSTTITFEPLHSDGFGPVIDDVRLSLPGCGDGVVIGSRSRSTGR